MSKDEVLLESGDIKSSILITEVGIAAKSVNFTPEQLASGERRALVKIDLVVIPLMGMYYLLSFLDRTNIGNARLAGLQRDLKMSNHDFSTSLTLTYIPLVLAEFPMNLLMKRLGANVTLPFMVIMWGMVCACQGAVTTYHGFLACRFILGVLEAGILPGIVLYMSSFYRRSTLQFRFACMFSVTSLAGAFSGLLAAAIENMDGLRGIPAWAWIFILEGVFTTVFGLVTAFLVPSSIRTFGLLSREEKVIYSTILAEDWSGDADNYDDLKEEFSWQEVRSAFTAPHILMACPPLLFNGVLLYGLANFSPTIVNGLGFSPSRSQLLTVPPYACSFVICIASSYLSDRYRQRGACAVFASLVAAAGFAIFTATPNKHADYGALFLQIIGTYSLSPCLGTWNANNVQPHYRRATAIAMTFACTNMGGILSTWIFIGPPRFRVASIVNLSFSLGVAVFSAFTSAYIVRANLKKRAMVQEMRARLGKGKAAGEWDSKEERRRLGDRHPCFEYTP